MEEQQLIRGCIDGDRKCQEALYKKFSRKMFGVCLGYSKNYEKAKDFLQEAFIKIFQNLDKFDAKGSLEGWIRRIVVNTAIDHYRKEIRYASETQLSEVVVYADKENLNYALKKLESDEFRSILQALPDGYRVILNLYIVEEYTHREIAALLGISEITSRTQLFKAKASLLKLLENNVRLKNLLQEYYEN